jgi:chemotaxis protein CheC
MVKRKLKSRKSKPRVLKSTRAKVKPNPQPTEQPPVEKTSSNVDLTKLNKFQDALNEVGNMGAGKASGVLSRKLNKAVNLTVPGIYLTPIENVPNLVGGSKELVVSAYSSLTGDLNGTVMTIFPVDSARKIVDVLSKKKLGTTATLAKMDQAKLRSIGDEISKAYLAAIKSFLKIKITPSSQRIVSTFGESLVDLVLLGVKERYALLLKTEFTIEGDVKGDFVLLLAIDSISNIVDAIGKQLGDN